MYFWVLHFGTSVERSVLSPKTSQSNIIYFGNNHTKKQFMCFHSVNQSKKEFGQYFCPRYVPVATKKLCSYANKNLFLQCVVSYVRSPSVEINGRGPTKRINFCNEPHTQEGKEANWKWNKKWIRVDCIVQERPCNKTTLTLSHRNSHQMLQQMIILHLDWILLTLSLSLSLLYNHFALKWTSWPRDHSKRENYIWFGTHCKEFWLSASIGSTSKYARSARVAQNQAAKSLTSRTLEGENKCKKISLSLG